MKRIILSIGIVGIGILFTAVGMAQQENTIYQVLATNTTAKPITTSVVRAIGQVNHLGILVLGDNTPATCISPVTINSNYGAYIEGSYDGVNYFEIPQKIRTIYNGTATARYITYLNGTGSYPYIHLVVTGYDNTNCKITTLAYSGNITAQNDYDKGINLATSQGTGKLIQFPVDIVGTVTNSIQCPGLDGLRMSLYGLYLYNEDAQTVIVNGLWPDAVTTNELMHFANLAANTTINLPIANDAYAETIYNASIVISTTAAAGKHLSGFIVCRAE